MKKVLLFAALFAMSRGAYAQAGALKVTNSSPCDVYVTMFAMDPSTSSSDGICTITSNSFTVAAGTTMSWTDPVAFETIPGPGWAYIPVGPIPSTTTEFNWTDVSFQFGCPLPYIAAGGSDAGGTMADPYLEPPGYTCFPSPSSWTGPGTPSISGSWASSGGYLANVVITF